MPRQLELSPEANQQLAGIVSYLASEFQLNVLQRFQEHWDFFTETAVKYPLRYPFYRVNDGKRVHKAILLNLTVILFTFDDEQVLIQAIFDARSDWQGRG